MEVLSDAIVAIASFVVELALGVMRAVVKAVTVLFTRARAP